MKQAKLLEHSRPSSLKRVRAHAARDQAIRAVERAVKDIFGSVLRRLAGVARGRLKPAPTTMTTVPHDNDVGARGLYGPDFVPPSSGVVDYDVGD